MRIFLLLLSSLRVFSSLLSISSGSKSGKARRLVPSEDASSSWRLSGLSESGKGELCRFRACEPGGRTEDAAAILRSSAATERRQRRVGVRAGGVEKRRVRGRLRCALGDPYRSERDWERRTGRGRDGEKGCEGGPE